MPLPSTVNTTSKTVSSNITGFGTFAIGYDLTVPVITWNSTNVSYDGINVEAYITDDGSGVNSSSIRIYLDGVSQNYSFAPFTGRLFANLSTGTGNHTIRIYGEDTSGNNNYTEKEINVFNNSRVIDLKLNLSENYTSIILSWAGISGNYSIQQYEIYRDGELIYNTTESNITLNITGSSTFMVIPKDINNNSGIGSAITYQTGDLVPEFTYNWNDTFKPTTSNPITFDASSSHVVNGTFERQIISYEWIFNDDLNETDYGIIINHSFVSPGLNKVSLKLKDNFNNVAELNRVLNITLESNPPASITNLTNASYAQTYINWTWTDPADPDFDKVMVYLDGVYQVDVLRGIRYYLATVSPGTYTIGTRTVDINGNINSTMVTHTATTILPEIRYINGTVRDNITKAGIEGVTVFTNINNSKTTNVSGFYSFAVTAGTYNLTALFEPRYYPNSTISANTTLYGVVRRDIELIEKPTGNITGNVIIS